MTQNAKQLPPRLDPELVGRAAYEADLKLVPRYLGGEPRPTWDKLPDFYKRTWERKPRAV